MSDDEHSGLPGVAMGDPSVEVQSAGATAGAPKSEPRRPFTLGVDIGGTGLKASVVDADAVMVADRVKVPTTYPMPPDKLVSDADQAGGAVAGGRPGLGGFPGHGAGRQGPLGTALLDEARAGQRRSDPELAEVWSGFDLSMALTEAFVLPTKVANDADIQGAAVVSGQGLELAITLGTGFGTGLFYRGQLMPHLEIAHQPFRKGETYNQQLGEATRKEIGEERWNKRVLKAITTLRALLFFDHLYIGGGNSRRVNRHLLDDDVTIVDNTAGILGGVKLWTSDHVGVNEAQT